MSDHIGFVNEYLTQRDIVGYLLATDVYVTPYLDPNQITSGTLAYALGAGKAIVSTPYLHAVEALDEGRGSSFRFGTPARLPERVAAFLAIPGSSRGPGAAATRSARGPPGPRAGPRCSPPRGLSLG